MKRFAITAAALTLALTGCSSTGTDAESAFLAEHDLTGMESVEIIDHLDRLGGTERPTDLMASVRAEELVLSDSEQEVSLEIPDEQFYLSFAPYVNQTHECYFHSLTTCQGELAGEDVQVTIVDEAGEVLLDERKTTFENGFVGLWLPRDIEGTLQVTLDGLTGEVDFGTGEDDATCLTTVQLA